MRERTVSTRRAARRAAGSKRRIRKTVRPVAWEGAGVQSPARDPIVAGSLHRADRGGSTRISHHLTAEARDKTAITSLRLLAVLGVLCRGDVGPEADAARLEARATSRRAMW